MRYTEDQPNRRSAEEKCQWPEFPGGSLCYCTCAQEGISTKSAGRKWLVSGLEDHMYLSVTKSATRRQPVGGTPTSKQEPCSGMHLMLSLSTGPWICHISSRVQVWTDSNGNAESPPPHWSQKKVPYNRGSSPQPVHVHGGGGGDATAHMTSIGPCGCNIVNAIRGH